jgi:hypothetical protein
MPPYIVLKIHFSITLSSTLMSSKWPFTLRFPHQNPVRTSPPSYVLHAPSVSLIWSCQLYFGWKTYNEAPRCNPKEKFNPEVFCEVLTVSTSPNSEQDYSFWAVQIAYSIYSQLPSIMEVVSPSATRGRATPWWQGRTYYWLKTGKRNTFQVYAWYIYRRGHNL